MALAIIAVVYKRYSPYGYVCFPRCPFLSMTGYKCPGCGSQRCIHDLLNLNMTGALKENMLVVMAIPYLLTGFVFDNIKHQGAQILKWRKILFGQQAIYIILTIISLFWIIRNII